MDLRDGHEYLANVSIGDCPIARFHAKIRAEHGRPCNLCNGKGYYLRFEPLKAINSVGGEHKDNIFVQRTRRKNSVPDVPRGGAAGPPTILEAFKARKNAAKDATVPEGAPRSSDPGSELAPDATAGGSAGGVPDLPHPETSDDLEI